MLGYSEGKRTSAKLGAIRLLMQPLKDKIELVPRVLDFVQNLFQRTDDTLVTVLKICRYKMIFGWKMMRSMPTARMPSR
jgi:hypothetical protein